ncbi:MAG: ATP-dependent RNA helicase HrpA [Gammaproteobacteria bacterium]|nr:ATP-dependent RNA helicase HrpA [Gammaproteobacteria bacterium]MCW8910096.1 ATP-dependent RNA helicase HrpA [Gammaproteobacteria bacterium]MCW9004701.1 ATP-dependent RNA helicase HrpA [Gammaproteobacteria bacterium]MCW9057054.1 ATP-dependent RNA helicase HrpA [Gammaproteobacteria bacterium]
MNIKQKLNKLRPQLDHCMLVDRPTLFRQLKKLQDNSSKNLDINQGFETFNHQLEQSIATATDRKTRLPEIQLADELPVSQKKDEISNAIKQHQVIIICGETGSGKTTQLPKICLQTGLGIKGLIGHTQPRRLAARTVASRIAEEMKSELGKEVGYKVRFTDKSNARSYIKLMTDGILLAEIQHDPYLNQYDTLIIDEAHERSLNIDFLLGYLKQLTQKRKDLKLIITSATIDPEKFSRHFNDAPIIEVSGRTYPVEIRYRPLFNDDEEQQQQNLQQGILSAIDELSRDERGDILVFLSGERDIRETTDYLRKAQLHNTEVLPLLARLSNQEQNRIFHTSSQRRIVLATNVAETSLTVPGIKYVIDAGFARISRYSWRSKMQRLPIEKISQSSANQRSGRCGRVSSGICIRLYSEDDFNTRPLFTEPEIQRTNLSAVILQMENMQLGHVEKFPFIEPPDTRLIKDGYKLLFELGAITDKHRLTATGKKLSRLPVDPKLARILIEAEKESSLNEVLIICSALSIQDPRERPMDRQQAADQSHATLRDNQSDFISFLNLWNKFQQQKQNLSGNKLRQWCKQHFISWMRMREWQDTHQQIQKMLRDLKLKFNQQEADYSAIHRALLTGFLGNLGFKDEEQQYLGTRNRKFYIFPGSGLFKKGPKWLMAAEIVETTRIYARCAAKVEVQWIEDKSKHLVKHSYSHVHWEKKTGQISAFQKSTLNGLVINAKRKINYGPINPAESREIFIRSALVDGDFNCTADFFKHNQALIEQLETLEAKSRRQDILVDEQILYDFYDQHIPQDMYNAPAFNHWVKQLEKKNSKILYLNRDYLMQHDAAHITDNQFPDFIEINGSLYPLEYHFAPDNKRDGISLITPLAGLAAINAQRCEWLVPGMLLEKITELIRSLPKQLRKNFIPAPDFAKACIEAMTVDNISLSSALSAQLKKITGIDIAYDAWREDQLDDHLFMNFRVIDHQGKTLAESRDLNLLLEQHATSIEHTEAADISHELEVDNVDLNILDQIPETVDLNLHGVTLQAYPCLVKEGKNIALRIVESKQLAEQNHKIGLRQLFINALTDQIRYLKSHIPEQQKLCLYYASVANCEQLTADFIACIIDKLFTSQIVNNRDDFETLLEKNRSHIMDEAGELSNRLLPCLSEYHQLRKALKNPPLHLLDALNDIQEQISHLIYPHFILQTDSQWLNEYPRYFKAITLRLDKIHANPDRDRANRIEIQQLWQSYCTRLASGNHSPQERHKLDEYRWMLEEYRVSLFAQELKTKIPVSSKRLKTLWNEINAI